MNAALYTMNVRIILPELTLKYVSSVEIIRSWNMLTDTATVTLPRELYFGLDVLKDKIKVGNKIEIQLAYNGIYTTEFKGYISRIITSTPLVLKCEDEMWNLKQIAVNKSYKNTNLKSLITDILPSGLSFDTADIELGSLLFKKMTVAKVLQKLKDDFKIFSYFVNSKLIVGKIYTDNSELVKFGFEKNIEAHDLEYKTVDDIKIKVSAESINSDGSNLKVIVGDEDGQESSLIYRNVPNEAKLKEMATADLERMKVDGYSGSITTFGFPFCDHGYTANLQSNQYPERDGNYYIDEVNVSWSNAGFRRVLKIGKKAA